MESAASVIGVVYQLLLGEKKQVISKYRYNCTKLYGVKSRNHYDLPSCEEFTRPEPTYRENDLFHCLRKYYSEA